MHLTMRTRLLLILLVCWNVPLTLSYSFTEEFSEDWKERWVPSSDEKYQGSFEVDSFEPDYGLKVPKKALHYGLTAKLEETFDPADGVILQFEAKWSEQQTCSGAYLKFYSHGADFKPEDMKADTKYTVMFGPDKCGTTSKVHFILNHKNPKTGEIVEKHLSSPPKVPADKKSHVYTAVLNSNNTFEVMLDDVVLSAGSLFELFEPPFNPPEEIPDPDDKKPEDWVDLAKIDDPEALKPEDWVEEKTIPDMDVEKPEGWLDDEPAEVVDPDAVKPEEWDEEEDGDWIPSSIPNPKCKAAPGCGEWIRPTKPNPDYKGPWKAPKIDNPEYKGPWKARMIPNPDFYVDETPLKNLAPIGSVGFELWTMDEGILFDNVIITKDSELAKKYRDQWEVRHGIEEEKEKEEKEKREKKRKKDLSDKEGAAGFLQRLIDEPYMEFAKPYLQPVVDFAEDNSPGFYGFMAVLGTICLLSLVRCCRRRPQVDEVGRGKKEDITGPDDPAEPAAQSSSKASNGADDEKDKEEEEEEEEEKEKEKTTSRRTRRAD